MGLFDSNEENIRKKLEKMGLHELTELQEEEKKSVENVINLVELGKSQSFMTEKSTLIAQVFLLEAISVSNLLNFQKLDQLNKNIEKLINK